MYSPSTLLIVSLQKIKKKGSSCRAIVNRNIITYQLHIYGLHEKVRAIHLRPGGAWKNAAC